MGQFSDPVATHPRTNEVEVPPGLNGKRLLRNLRLYDFSSTLQLLFYNSYDLCDSIVQRSCHFFMRSDAKEIKSSISATKPHKAIRQTPAIRILWKMNR